MFLFLYLLYIIKRKIIIIIIDFNQLYALIELWDIFLLILIILLMSNALFDTVMITTRIDTAH